MNKMSVPCEMLLHPELLSNEQLIAILQERHLRISNIKDMDRDELLELFHHYCLPYGQRKYRDSGRGKLLNKSRNIPENAPNDMIIEFQDCTRRSRTYTDRLKPPPDLLSGHIKRMKISVEVESKQCPNDTGSSNKRRISMNTINTPEGPPKKKDRKLVTWP